MRFKLKFVFFGMVLFFCIYSIFPSPGGINSPLYLQKIPLNPLAALPEIDTPWPVSTTYAEGRLWLAWPQVLISLDPHGRADVYTLLAYQASRLARGKYRPAPGGITPEGTWASLRPQGLGMDFLDTVLGEQQFLPLNLPSEGNLWALNKKEFLLVDPGGKAWILGGASLKEKKAFPAVFPPRSALAVDPQGQRLAWFGVEDGLIHLQDIPSGRYTSFPPPGGRPLSLAWVKGALACGYPDTVALVDPQRRGYLMQELFTGSLPPWYLLHGSQEGLALQDPLGKRILLAREKTKSNPKSIDLERMKEEDFLDLLIQRFALEAGSILEAKGRRTQAETLYGWALPHIRRIRSQNPLDSRLPRVEEEMLRRRKKLQ